MLATCLFLVTNSLRHARLLRRVIVTVMRDFFVASLSPSPSCASSLSRHRHRLLRHEDGDGRVIVSVFFVTNFLRHARLRRVIVAGMRDFFVASSSPSPSCASSSSRHRDDDDGDGDDDATKKTRATGNGR